MFFPIIRDIFQIIYPLFLAIFDFTLYTVCNCSAFYLVKKRIIQVSMPQLFFTAAFYICLGGNFS